MQHAHDQKMGVTGLDVAGHLVAAGLGVADGLEVTGLSRVEVKQRRSSHRRAT